MPAQHTSEAAYGTQLLCVSSQAVMASISWHAFPLQLLHNLTTPLRDSSHELSRHELDGSEWGGGESRV